MGKITLKKLQPKPQAKAIVSEQHVHSGTVTSESQEQEAVQVPTDIETPTKELDDLPWCTVGSSMSYTHNLGNYNSIKFQVSVTIPCKHTEIDATYAYAENWVEERIGKMKEAIES